MTVKENLLQQRVLDLCNLLHLKTMLIQPALVYGKYRTPYAKGSTGKGWPDLTAVGPGGALFRELKRDGEYPKPEQRAWLAALSAAGLDAAVWKTADWESGRIESELRAIAKAKLGAIALTELGMAASADIACRVAEGQQMWETFAAEPDVQTGRGPRPKPVRQKPTGNLRARNRPRIDLEDTGEL